MSRHPAAQGERDANHGELAQVYRDLFCSVVDTGALGFGFPDAVVGCGGCTDLVEFKTADGTLNAAQTRFLRDWRGSKVKIVRTRDEVIAHVTEIRGRHK